MFDLILDSVEDFHTVEERRLHRIFGGLGAAIAGGGDGGNHVNIEHVSIVVDRQKLFHICCSPYFLKNQLRGSCSILPRSCAGYLRTFLARPA